MNVVVVAPNRSSKEPPAERARLIDAAIAAGKLGGPEQERAVRKVLAVGRPSNSPFLISEVCTDRRGVKRVSLDAGERGVVLIRRRARHINLDMSEEIVWRDANLRGEPLCTRAYVPNQWRPKDTSAVHSPLRMDTLAEAARHAVVIAALKDLERRIHVLGDQHDVRQALAEVATAMTMLS